MASNRTIKSLNINGVRFKNSHVKLIDKLLKKKKLPLEDIRKLAPTNYQRNKKNFIENLILADIPFNEGSEYITLVEQQWI